jgi:hypothetical protein
MDEELDYSSYKLSGPPPPLNLNSNQPHSMKEDIRASQRSSNIFQSKKQKEEEA